MSKKRKGRTTAPKVKQARLVAADYWTLHAVARFVDPDDDIASLARRMAVTCTKNNGLAVAAPQVGADVRLVVLHDGRAVLNPSVYPDMTRGTSVEREGCLSYPNRWWHVERRLYVDVAGVDAFTGEPIAWREDDALLARMWQHEVDHLDGLVLLGRFAEVENMTTAPGSHRGPMEANEWLDALPMKPPQHSDACLFNSAANNTATCVCGAAALKEDQQ